ncbi:30S ribosomal protein S6 [Candidatus Saccharibacteria bacterium]|nr:30S ribosomal protein S6 [Candidatus Saccharibacteria bacterium]
MKEYELSVLYHPDLEMNIDPALDKVKKIVETAGGTIESVSDDGKKRLAYPIKGQTFAIYYYYIVSLPSEAPAKISAVMNITDEVLRYLLVRKDERRETEGSRDAESEERQEKAEEAKENNETKK